MKQPEALRLADVLVKNFWTGQITVEERGKAAAELRRLHSENQELLDACIEGLEFLRFRGSDGGELGAFMRAAIAKATGGQS